MDAVKNQVVADGGLPSFGQEHFGACVLQDKRLTDRAVITADAFMRHPGGTLPQKLVFPELLGFYDFANNKKVNHALVMEGHFRRTRECMAACTGTVLIIHDTTEADYSGLSIPDQGPIGNGLCQGLLLTNVPTQGKSQAWERVDWYECRPIVEEFHKAQKTGCGIENLQFTTRKALETAIGMLSVVATQLLRLRDISRRPDGDTRRADDVVDPQYVQIMSLRRFKEERPAMSVKEFLYALARLGGHLGRRLDRLPGWLVLWRGWSELQRLVEGARLLRLKRSG